jgi:beta-catenin-like protein 1
VSIDALNLLHELVDAEELGSGDEELEPFLSYVTGRGGSSFLATMVRALARFPTEHSKESTDAVTHILAIIENLTDLEPRAVSERLVQETGMMEWMMQRLKAEAFNANKLYTSEILSIMMTSAGVTGQNQLGATVFASLP